MRGSTTALTLLLWRAAAAQDYAALPPVVVPAAAPEIVGRLHDAVVLGLTAGGQTAVAAADVRALLARRGDLTACREGPCLKEVIGALKTRRVVVTHVAVAGKNYDLKMDLHGDTDDVLATRSTTCDICTLTEAEATLMATAGDLVRNAPPWPGAPPAAVPVGTTQRPGAAAAPAAAPVPHDVAPAKESAVARSAGSVTIARAPASRPAPSRRRYYVIAAGAAIGGVGAMLAGGFLVAKHGDCSNRDPDGTCIERSNTGAAGAALVGTGVVAFGGAAIATWLGIRSRARLEAAPSPSGVVARAVFEF
jgi:hypothetical protein